MTSWAFKTSTNQLFKAAEFFLSHDWVTDAGFPLHSKRLCAGRFQRAVGSSWLSPEVQHFSHPSTLQGLENNTWTKWCGQEWPASDPHWLTPKSPRKWFMWVTFLYSFPRNYAYKRFLGAQDGGLRVGAKMIVLKKVCASSVPYSSCAKTLSSSKSEAGILPQKEDSCAIVRERLKQIKARKWCCVAGQRLVHWDVVWEWACTQTRASLRDDCPGEGVRTQDTPVGIMYGRLWCGFRGYAGGTQNFSSALCVWCHRIFLHNWSQTQPWTNLPPKVSYWELVVLGILRSHGPFFVPTCAGPSFNRFDL